MGIFDPGSAVTTEATETQQLITITPIDTQISYYMTDWQKWHGMYRKHSIIAAVIDKLAIWAAGKGIQTKESSRKKQLEKIRGFGKDTTRDIAINLIRTAILCGNSYAEPVWDDRGALINLIPRSPGTIRHITNSKGIVTHYEQIELKQGDKPENQKVLHRWTADEIFHLPWNRIADEVGGIGICELLERDALILDNAEEKMSIIVNRCAKPIPLISADTDNDTEMNSIKTKYGTILDKGEALVYPKDAIEIKDFASELKIDIQPFMDYIERKILKSCGVPESVLGISSNKETEGDSKIKYLAYQQATKNIQDWFEQQWMAQLGFEIDLPEPPSIDPMVLTDARKAGSLNAEKGNKNLKNNELNPEQQNK